MNIKKHIILISLMLIPNIAVAEKIKLVVPQMDIHNAVKMTKKNMAVRNFDIEKLADVDYLTPKEFNSVIGKTVSIPIKGGDPIPQKAVIPLWQTYSLDNDTFSIEMPGKIKSLNSEQSQEKGTQTFYVEQGLPNLEQGFHSYQLHYTNYPPDKTPDPGKNNLIKNMRDYLVDEMKLEGIELQYFKENEISLNDYSGIELISVMKSEGQTGYLHQRLYQVGYRQYFLMVFSPSFETPEADRNRFFNSFRIQE